MSRDKALTVEIVDGQLSITIGVDTLMVAAKGGDAWTEGDEVVSADGFADEILAELEREEEDGTTLVHIAIDNAIQAALDAGSLNIRYADDEE